MASYVSPGSQQNLMDSSRDTSTTSIVPGIYMQHGSGSPNATANSQVELIPHRIFVGGFPSATVEHELRTFFETYGRIREVKIIRSPDGSPKGYGFVTFETEEEAQAVRKQCEDGMEFKGRRLNVGPAMRRITASARLSDLAVATPTVMFSGSYAAGGAFVVPEGYFVAGGQQGAAYTVMVPGQTGAYTPVAYHSPFSYTPAVSQQPRYVMPVASGNGNAGNTVSQGQNSPEKSAISATMSPTRYGTTGSGGNGHGGTQLSPHNRQNMQATPHGNQNQTSGTGQNQHHQGTYNTTHTPAYNHYGYNQPLTPITPGMNQQQPGFRWPAPHVQYNAPVYPHTAMYSSGTNGYYQVADMTHYSQMYPSMHQDYYDYQNVYGTPADSAKLSRFGAGGAFVANDDTGSLFQMAAAMISEDARSEESSTPQAGSTPQSSPTKEEAQKNPCPVDPVTPEKKAGRSVDSTKTPSPRPARAPYPPRHAGWVRRGGAGGRAFGGQREGRWMVPGRRGFSLPNSPVGFRMDFHPPLDAPHEIPVGLGTDSGSKPQSPAGNRSGSARNTPRKAVVSLTGQMNQLALGGGAGNGDVQGM